MIGNLRTWMLVCAAVLAPAQKPLGAAGARPAVEGPVVVDFDTLVRAIGVDSAEGLAALPIRSSAVHSSRDLGSVTPEEPAAWFSEADTGNAVRIERGGGRTEWVLADLEGAGAIARIVLNAPPAMRDAVLRIRIDGERTPSIEWPLRLIEAQVAVQFSPFVTWHRKPARSIEGDTGGTDEVGVGTVDCILPIPFAQSCVITLDRRPELYRIESIAFAEGVEVKRAAIDGRHMGPGTAFAQVRDELVARIAMRPTARTVLRGDGSGAGLTPASIAPGGRVERTVDAPGEGGGVIRSIAIRIDPFQASAAVRDLWIECDFDGARAIRMPLGFFIGLGEATGPTADAFRAVGADGSMEFRLPMPFARGARVAIANRGKKPLECALAVVQVDGRGSDEPPQLLHGAVRIHRRLVIDKPFEVELARIDGEGTLVGECYSQNVGYESWWPTGDERLKIDGRDELAGPAYDLVFGSSPGLPRFARGALVSVPARTEHLQGLRWSASRLRALDRVRFSQSFVQTLELQPALEPGCEMSLSHAVLWYARAGESRGIGFDDPETMPSVTTPSNLAPLAETFAAGEGEEWFEAEHLAVTFWSPGTNWGPEFVGFKEPRQTWGGGSRMGLVASRNGIGDAIEFVVPARDDQPRRLAARFMRMIDSARVTVTVNGVRVPGDVVLGSPETIPSDLVDLGIHEPKDGAFVVRITVAGTSSFASRRMQVLVDGFRASRP